MKNTAIIMAGGKGERFWPRSRKNMPKQFLSLTEDGKTLIQLTVERLKSLVDIEDTFIVTNKDYKELVLSQIPNIPEENILLEPVARNTAPCVGLAAMHVKKKYGDATMIVLPSDHLIKYNEFYIDTLKVAIDVAEEENNLITIGIMPSYPETGYGYINFERNFDNSRGNNVYKVNSFVEKPDLNTAKEYLASGRYLWNSGMFVWKASSILLNIRELLPDMYNGLERIYETIDESNSEIVLKEAFENMKSESIDYGIMERANDIYTIPGSFGWDDVGSWLALERINKTNDDGNVVKGNVITIDTKKSIIQAQDKLIATVGIKDVIIIDTEDVLLIANKEDTQNIKKIIENLKICNRDCYL
ncbi:mannose-1-phosphate guanylyltransferase [Clostridium saccharoperbutylacetonicum]|uniref:mannose-1-phosphate guanylyltransferase n=1 Tax=Clostridium saccharoperbutylacetonicum N1-4(HMT) TaxID=931276 RepID=M1LN10_9CLOT|nr:mannose-1-phosphate guanylyltransferase [Clostridium saccharoperbutylacetonicum]AGF54185.1 putative mannose-1-phosphate guanylyltransferase RfbA [Clostridium saccharoperbutylacetonicum N1-4(HMT)]NRT59301.1 mannose-1-phosphate guanylyltransferase [Clostridium saccharoperbutylacetonicum]NSB28492.1 mannose-1-phosphate guanylyltransferase [Clostridium saccharoperbutylacetonicum]NSB41983.1 mannose-1-phosphate guanylyltransferase [Clostridium saccharoperbutylacetonicum]